VFDLNIEKVFGPSFQGFKTTNLHNLHLEIEGATKALLVGIWYKLNDENEFMIWLMKGYIA
jgi:hypothetical protein